MSSLPKDYGWVIFSGAAAWGTVTWMGINVSRARKKYGVPYPKLYSETEDMFNCVQRAHQHTLEIFPPFLFFLSIAGLKYPRFAAGCGGVWSLGRIAFAKGYYTGKPEKREYGAFGTAAMLVLIGTSVAFGIKKLELV